MADTPNAELRVAAEDGLALVNEMENLKEAGISPQYYGDAAKALILLWGTKIGFGLGFRRGRGFMLVKLPRHHHASGSTNRWSAPIFVKVNVGEFGLCFGCAQSRSMLLAMSDKLPHQLIAEKGGHSMLGVDNTFTMFNTATETKSDVISLSSGVSDVAGASVVKGVMLDFSLAGGWLSVDEEKMKNVYGTTPTTVSTTIARSVVSGATPPPPEMMPLYDYINKLIAGASFGGPPPSLTRASVQRFTAGIDPDRRIISSESGRLLDSGDPEENVEEIRAREK